MSDKRFHPSFETDCSNEQTVVNLYRSLFVNPAPADNSLEQTSSSEDSVSPPKSPSFAPSGQYAAVVVGQLEHQMQTRVCTMAIGDKERINDHRRNKFDMRSWPREAINLSALTGVLLHLTTKSSTTSLHFNGS